MPHVMIWGAIYLAGLISGLVLPQLNIWPYSACHGLGGFIDITDFDGGGQHGSRCVIPWSQKEARP